MTYGALRLRLSKLLPGIDLELIDGWIQDRYTEILDLIPWKRQEKEIILQSPVSYADGTVAVTQGSASITGTGTIWTALMNGRMIRINNTSEYYSFTRVSGTMATLDRVYEGPTDTGLAYRIDQAIFQLPSNARIVRQVTPLHDRGIPVNIVTPGDLNRMSPSRNLYGTPKHVAPTWDDASDPPVLQLEFFAVPHCPDSGSALLSWAVDIAYDAADLDPNATSASLLPFVRPAALIAGVEANAMMPRPGYDGNIAAAQAHEIRFQSLREEMLQVNNRQRGPQQIRLAPELRRQTPPAYRRGPWHRGYTG